MCNGCGYGSAAAILARSQILDAAAVVGATPKRIFDAEAVSRAAGHSTPADSCAATAATDRDCSAAADPDSDAFDPVRPGCADWAVC